MSTRFAPDSNTAKVTLRNIAAVDVSAAGRAAIITIHVPLPRVLGSMLVCAVARVAGWPIVAGPATRRLPMAVSCVVLGRWLHHLARVVLVLLAAPLAFRPTREEFQS